MHGDQHRPVKVTWTRFALSVVPEFCTRSKFAPGVMKDAMKKGRSETHFDPSDGAEPLIAYCDRLLRQVSLVGLLDDTQRPAAAGLGMAYRSIDVTR